MSTWHNTIQFYLAQYEYGATLETQKVLPSKSTNRCCCRAKNLDDHFNQLSRTPPSDPREGRDPLVTKNPKCYEQRDLWDQLWNQPVLCIHPDFVDFARETVNRYVESLAIRTSYGVEGMTIDLPGEYKTLCTFLLSRARFQGLVG